MAFITVGAVNLACGPLARPFAEDGTEIPTVEPTFVATVVVAREPR